MGEGFSFTEHDESDGSVRVRVVGEFDVGGAPALQEVLRRLEGEGRDVLLDLSGVWFMDLYGLHVVAEASEAARQGGVGFAIDGDVPREVRRVFIDAGAVHHLPGRQAHLAEPSDRGPHGATVASGADLPGAGGSDQTLADRDQTAADRDQTSADRDQDAADADQGGADRDQAAADRDQRAADRDHAARADGARADDVGYEDSRQARRRSTDSRDEATELRRSIADDRDRTATERDATAAERDAAAAARDLAAYGADGLADIGERSAHAEQSARRARADRERAQMNRDLAARDREQAARDREQAARDRGQLSRRARPGRPRRHAADLIRGRVTTRGPVGERVQRRDSHLDAAWCSGHRLCRLDAGSGAQSRFWPAARCASSDVAKLAHDVARSRPSLVRRRQRWRPEFSS